MEAVHRRKRIMLEELFVTKYANYGKTSPSGELYLPLSTSNQFVNECTSLKVAIIGLEFFHIGPEYVMPVSPLSGIDCSIFLKTSMSWDEVVNRCNEAVIKVLQQEEKRDHTQWYHPTLFERDEWVQASPEQK
jgi:hypothetical protein